MAGKRSAGADLGRVTSIDGCRQKKPSLLLLLRTGRMPTILTIHHPPKAAAEVEFALIRPLSASEIGPSAAALLANSAEQSVDCRKLSVSSRLCTLPFATELLKAATALCKKAIGQED